MDDNTVFSAILNFNLAVAVQETLDDLFPPCLYVGIHAKYWANHLQSLEMQDDD